MPRKSKITAVPVDQPEVVVTEEEPKTDAQEMSEVINEIREVEEPVVEEVAGSLPQGSQTKGTVAEPSAPAPDVVPAKPKAKRASRAKTKAMPAEPVVEVTQTLEEVVAEVEIPQEENKEVKVAEKVKCPDCGKQMSAKTLKYSHGPNCVVKKKEAQEVPRDDFPKDAFPKDASGAGAGASHRAEPNVTDEMIEELIQTRMNSVKRERLVRREEALEKLVAGALP
jgi:hypothetical protein